MKLLLDEHYSEEIARRLRSRGHNVVGVREAGLAGLDDQAVLEAAVAEGRAVVTNNVRHFMPLHNEWLATGRDHLGIVFTSDASMPRAKRTIGLFVRRLEKLLAAHRRHDGLAGSGHWLD